MADVKPTPGRIVLFYRDDVKAAPWPALVVEAREVKGVVQCDLQLFATRGHGVQPLKEDVPFTPAMSGTPNTCSYPPRAE